MGGMVTGIYKMATASDVAQSAHAANDYENFNAQRASEIGQLEAQQKGTYEAGKLRTLGTQLIARQRTAYANSGVDPTQGTPLAVMADTRLMNETDARMAENNAAREVRGYKIQGEAARRRYDARQKEIDDAKTATMVGGATEMFGSFLSGGFSLGGK